VVIFLETAELRAKDRKDLTMSFWKENVDLILHFNDRKILKGLGAVSNALMEEKVAEIYEQFNARRKVYEAQIADNTDIEQIKELEEKVKRIKK
jgi:hypothetical protein